MTLVPSLLDPVDCRAAAATPPPDFRPLGYAISASWEHSGATGGRGMTAAQKAGLRYEARVQTYLQDQLGENYHIAPILNVLTDTGLRCLIPDGVYFSEHYATVVEIKSQHMPESWWQMRRLYEPAVMALGVVSHINCLTVVRSFDPAMPYPEAINRVYQGGLLTFINSLRHKIGVFVWRPTPRPAL